MKSCKKTLLPLILYTVLAAGLIAASFFDLQISQSIGDVNSAFGGFLEIWAEPPSLILCAFAFCAMGIYLFRGEKKTGRMLSLVCFLSAGVALFYTIHRTMRYYSETYGATAAAKLIAAAGAFVVLLLLIYLASLISQPTLEKLKKPLLLIITVALATLIIISAIKSVWGRVRFRELVRVGDMSGFTDWFRPVGRAASDAYKSFPSGHTSNAVVLFSATYLFSSLGKNRTAALLRALCIGWCMLVMFSRILCGAHFLSDVCMGALLTMTITIVSRYVIYEKN